MPVLDGVAHLLKEQVSSLGVLLATFATRDPSVLCGYKCLLPALSGLPAIAILGQGYPDHCSPCVSNLEVGLL